MSKFRVLATMSILCQLASCPAVRATADEKNVDAFGDLLPAGAVYRLGSQRLSPVHYVWGHRLAFTPDNKYLVTSSLGFVQFWDPVNGKLIQTWTDKRDTSNVGPSLLAFSADAKWLAVAPPNEKVRVRNAKNGDVKFTLASPAGAIAFCTVGKTLACAHCPELILYDGSSGAVKSRLAEYAWGAAIAFSPDGHYFAAGKVADFPTGAGYVGIWESETGKRICTLNQDGIRGNVRGITFLPDSKHVLISADQLTLHDTANGKLLRVVREKSMGRLATDAGSKRMIGTSGEIWDLEKLEVIHRVPLASNSELAISGDGTMAASTDPLRVWKVATGKATFDPPGHGFPFNDAVFSPDDRRLLTFSRDATMLHVWDARTGQHVECLKTKAGQESWREQLSVLRFSNDPDQLIIGWELWNLREKRHLTSLLDAVPKEAKLNPYSDIKIAPNRQIAVDWDLKLGVRFWDVKTGRLLRTLTLPNQQNQSWARFTFTPDSKMLGIAYHQGGGEGSHAYYLVEMDTGKLARTLGPDDYGSRGSPVFSLDDQWFVVNKNCDPAVEIWHVPSGLLYRELVDPALHSDAPYYYYPPFAIAGNGQLVAACGYDDDAIVLFEVITGQRICTLKGHTDRILTLAFSQDGRKLVTGSRDRTALVWSVENLAAKKRFKNEDCLWDALARSAAEAYPALWALLKEPSRAVALSKKLEPDPPANPKTLAQFVADLSSSKFALRSAATEYLCNLGLAVLPTVESALKQPNELEVRLRLELIRKKVLSQPPRPELVRDLRVIQLLEMMGTKPAKDALLDLTKGSDCGPRAVAAQGALARIEKRMTPLSK